MNKKNVATLSLLSLVVVGLSTPKLVGAFWPFDQAKDKSEVGLQGDAPAWGKRLQNLSPEEIQKREEHRATHMEERLQTLADFFGMDIEEVRSRLENGEKPRDIAEDSDKTIEEWREYRLEARKEHMREMGLSEEDIQAKIDWAKQRGRGKGMGKHFGR
ncbi:hypothetical protein ACFL1M_01120 [Patescibacteria group bacterium]